MTATKSDKSTNNVNSKKTEKKDFNKQDTNKSKVSEKIVNKILAPLADPKVFLMIDDCDVNIFGSLKNNTNNRNILNVI